ncbi:MAG TPA: AMP-binding protein, partial [Beijerinckiaceae bacterium]|nr:AMP-binding protein [Beijerinckiaceae bacterium]
MEKIWLKTYPAGVPAEIDCSEYGSIGALFDASVAKFRDEIAFDNSGATLSFDEVDRLSRQFGAWLQARGLARGDRIAIMMPNLLQYPVAIFAILRAGFVVVSCNPLYKPRELESQLCDSGARALIVVENFAHVAAQVLARTQVEHVVTTQLGDLMGFPKRLLVNAVVKHLKKMVPPWSIPGAVSFLSALRDGSKETWRPADVAHGDLAFLQYTGGTTGVPKGAMLTHGNVVCNLMQCHAWLKPAMRDGGQRAITALPLYHIFALTANCLMFFKIGARNVLITNPRDIPGLVKELRRATPFSLITGVNTL